MALPAGRYGVTKNQLLKIKKLPMNTIKLIEELTEKFDLLGTAAFKNSTSVVTESSDLVESGAVYTALQGKVDNSVIGTVEDGTNPTRSYAVDEHMIRNGKFCTVTVAVTTSSTWTLGSNYVEGTIADNLVKQATFDVTTNAAGVANLCDNGRIVLAIKSAGHVIQSYVTGSGTSINIKSYDYQGNLDTNVNITGTYYYI